jgi:hypothetical protein
VVCEIYEADKEWYEKWQVLNFIKSSFILVAVVSRSCVTDETVWHGVRMFHIFLPQVFEDGRRGSSSSPVNRNKGIVVFKIAT